MSPMYALKIPSYLDSIRAFRPTVLMRAVLILLAAAAALFGEDWPCFRGPSRQGVSSERNLALQWTADTGIAWSVDVPGESWSSPIVKGNLIFVTTATDGGASCRVLAYNTKAGKKLWETEVFRQTLARKEKRNSYATPTPVADAERVYAVFGGGGVAALDHHGKTLWTNRDLPYYSQHGLGGSPVLHDGRLIMARDHSLDGENAEEKKLGWLIPWDRSFVVALDAATGKISWKTGRGMSRLGHGTPTLLSVDGALQLISSAGGVVQGHNPVSGERLWNSFSQGEGVVPSPAVGEGLIFTASGFEKPTIRAFKPGGEMAWEQTKGVPMISSFLYAAPYLYSITTNGVAWCYRAATGEPVWQSRIGGNYSSSPVLAEGRIYFTSDEGETTVIAHGPEFKELARNPIGGRVQASLAIAGGRIYLRTASRLYAIGKN